MKNETQKVEVIRTTGLAKLDAATQALAKATDIQEIKQVRDVAEAIRKLAKTAGAGLDIQNEGAMLKIRAERKGGEKLKTMERHKKGDGRPKKVGHDVPLISDLGLSGKQATRWQAESDIPEKVQDEYFKQAKEKDLEITTAGFMREGQKNKPKPETPPLPKGKYNVIYADPPWEYRNTGVEGAVSKEYPTMSITELCKLPIEPLANKDAVLFMWVTNPLLQECFPVLESWGFEYKTNFCWHKSNRNTGVGFYVRGVHELLLISIKGSCLPVETPLSIIKANAGKHSQKPDSVYGIIEKMYPNGKYIELFARCKRKGWNSWGNEI